jgi:hypothetical protein
MALGSTQPLIEMSTRNLPGGEGRSARKAHLKVRFEPIIEKKCGTSHNPMGLQGLLQGWLYSVKTLCYLQYAKRRDD